MDTTTEDPKGRTGKKDPAEAVTTTVGDAAASQAEADAAAAVEAAVAEAAHLATEQGEGAATAETGGDAVAAEVAAEETTHKEAEDEDDGEAETVMPSIEVDVADQTQASKQSKRHSDVSERDVVLNKREDNMKMHLFLEDLVHMYNVLWQLQNKMVPTEAEIDAAARHVVQLLKHGKRFELSGLRDVPRPFLKAPGRILERGEDGVLQELSEDDAIEKIKKLVVDKVQKDPLGDRLNESPYKEFKKRYLRNEGFLKENNGQPSQLETLDAILSSCTEKDKELEQQGEAKVVFNVGPQQVLFCLAAQIVTTYTINAETQVKAALAVLNGLDETNFPPPRTSDRDDVKPPSKHSRFLMRSALPRTAEGTEPPTMQWNFVPDADVLEWAVTFVFEVHLEKDLDYILAMLPADHKLVSSEGFSKVPIKEPTNYDVLFGRGGMTNSHIGNRRFRDVIALSRPDYIRAIKMDKPAVARKIVKAIRYGNPPGRFLKKGDDGNWFDVGDRTAAEKTSQGLRERTNAEKRQRSQLRRALRLRKEDMEEEDSETGGAAKKVKVAGAGDTAVNLAATLAPTLNYVGTNIAVPLSLNMAQVVQSPTPTKKFEVKSKPNSLGLTTEGLPPNAVDEEGNILVTDYDILLGRGGLTNHHKGNKRFRDIVSLHRADYVRAPKIQKPSVARVIVRAIRNGDPPGRFLRKDEKTGKWVDVGDKKAAEKTSQALREKATEEREKLKAEPATGILVPSPASYLAATTANVIGSLLASGTFTGTASKEDDGSKSDEKEEPTKAQEESSKDSEAKEVSKSATEESKTEAGVSDEAKQVVGEAIEV